MKEKTNYERFHSMDLDALTDFLYKAIGIYGDEQIPFCVSKAECLVDIDEGRTIPESKCRQCMRAWLERSCEE